MTSAVYGKRLAQLKRSERINMRFFTGIVAVLISCIAATAYASSDAALYQVREELESQESTVRDAGLRASFTTLMQRLTGKAETAQAAQLAQYAANPQPLITHYDYDGNTLIVNYDPPTVRSVLRETALPVWATSRIASLVWWQVDDVQGLRLISGAHDAAHQLQSAAQHHGVPVRFPLGDLNEQLLISADVLTDHADVRALAERYGTDALVIVMAQQAGDQLHAQWQLWLGNKQQQGEVSAATSEELARSVFAQVNQNLVKRFATKPGEGEEFRVRVTGLNLERFALVERLLEPFAAQLQKVTPEYTQWAVRSTAEQLKIQLALAELQEVQAPLKSRQQGGELGVEQTSSDSAQMLYFSW